MWSSGAVGSNRTSNFQLPVPVETTLANALEFEGWRLDVPMRAPPPAKGWSSAALPDRAASEATFELLHRSQRSRPGTPTGTLRCRTVHRDRRGQGRTIVQSA